MKLNDETIGTLDGLATDFQYDVLHINDEDGISHATRLWYLRDSMKRIADLAQTLLPELDKLLKAHEIAQDLSDAQKKALQIAREASKKELYVWASSRNSGYSINRVSGQILARKGLLEELGKGDFKITKLGEMIADGLSGEVAGGDR